MAAQPATPPIPASPLERKAAGIRAARRREQGQAERFAAAQEAEHTTTEFALRLICPTHHATPGQGCWTLPSDDVHARHPSRAVCPERLAQALGMLRARHERIAREAARTQREAAREAQREAAARAKRWGR